MHIASSDYEKFKRSLGYKLPNEDSLEFLQAYRDWQERERIYNRLYAELLRELGLNIHGERVVEVNSTSLHTLTTPEEKNIVLTPYMDTFDIKPGDLRMFLDGNLFSSKAKEPHYYTASNGKLVYGGKIDADTFIDTNILYNGDYTNLRNVASTGHGIITGIYGGIHDTDKSDKIRKFKVFKEKLLADAEEYRDTIVREGMYVNLVYTDSKTIEDKILKKVL